MEQYELGVALGVPELGRQADRWRLARRAAWQMARAARRDAGGALWSSGAGILLAAAALLTG